MRKALVIFGLTAVAAASALAADAAAGKVIYDAKCKSCHGADGTPNAAIGKAMGVTMRDLKDPAVQATADADLAKIVTAGKGKMKATAGVTDPQAANVVAYVKTLKK